MEIIREKTFGGSSSLFGRVAEPICCALLTGTCYDLKISLSLYWLIGLSLALVMGASSLARVIQIPLVGCSIILFGMGAEKTYLLFLNIRTSLSFFFELCFPELALAIDLSTVGIFISLFGMVALAEISLQVRVKKHGQGQSSSGAGGSGAGNAGGSIGGGGDENGTISPGTGQGRRSGRDGGGQGRGNDDDDDNSGGPVVGNPENDRGPRNPTPEEIATIYLPIIIQSVANIMSLNDTQLSTTGRVFRNLSMIINSVGFICCAVVLWQPYSNPRVARILNRRITGFLSRIGSALAVLGFISMMSVDLSLYPSLIMGLAFLVLLAVFLIDISEAIQ